MLLSGAYPHGRLPCYLWADVWRRADRAEVMGTLTSDLITATDPVTPPAPFSPNRGDRNGKTGLNRQSICRHTLHTFWMNARLIINFEYFRWAGFETGGRSSTSAGVNLGTGRMLGARKGNPPRHGPCHGGQASQFIRLDHLMNLMGIDQRGVDGVWVLVEAGWSPSRRPVSTLRTWSEGRFLGVDRAPAGWWGRL
jgi:hypothetical protein